MSPPFFSMILLPREAFSSKKNSSKSWPMLTLTDEWNPTIKTTTKDNRLRRLSAVGGSLETCLWFRHLRHLTNQCMIPLSASKACPKLCRTFPLSITSLIFFCIQLHVLSFFPTKSLVGPYSKPSEGTAEGLSFEWSHHRRVFIHKLKSQNQFAQHNEINSHRYR